MSVMVTGNWGKALAVGLKAIWGNAYAKYPKEYLEMFDFVKSDKAYEEFLGTTGFGQLREIAENAPVEFDSRSQGFVRRFTHSEYGLGFVISKNLIEDNQYKEIGLHNTEALAFSASVTKETVLANIYNRAFNAAYTGADGVAMCSTAHPNKTGGTWSNKPAVDADLSESTLEQAVIDIGKFKDDRGNIIAAKPTKLVLPWDSVFLVERILKSSQRIGTANNDINALNSTGMISNVFMSHYLTDTNSWFIRTNVPHGMKYIERTADTFDKDEDFLTGASRFKVTCRYSGGNVDPRGIYGSSGT